MVAAGYKYNQRSGTLGSVNRLAWVKALLWRLNVLESRIILIPSYKLAKAGTSLLYTNLKVYRGGITTTSNDNFTSELKWLTAAFVAALFVMVLL